MFATCTRSEPSQWNGSASGLQGQHVRLVGKRATEAPEALMAGTVLLLVIFALLYYNFMAAGTTSVLSDHLAPQADCILSASLSSGMLASTCLTPPCAWSQQSTRLG